MADISESSVENTAEGETAAAIVSDTTPTTGDVATEPANGPVAAEAASTPVNTEASPERLLSSASDPAPASAIEATSSAEPAAAGPTGSATNDDTVLDVRPGFQITKLRPALGSFRSEPGKLPPSGKSAAVAASLAFACALGLLIGSVGAWGIGQLIASPHAGRSANAAPNDTAVLKTNIAHIEGQLAALKTSIDHTNKAVSSQSKSLSERYDRGARAQADLQARLAKIGETVDRLSKIGDNSERLAKIGETVERLEKRTHTAAASEVTGSVTPQRVAAAPAPLPVPPMSEPKKPSPPPVVEGWVLRDVFRGRALVASRHGVFEAAPGLELPGLGQVESIKQQDGRWVVVTEKGLIVASRGPRLYYR
jgi:hypothetical protein